MLEEREGNYRQALGYMELWKQHSMQPAKVQERIDTVRQKLTPEKSLTWEKSSGQN
jgi:hypothetical protein